MNGATIVNGNPRNIHPALLPARTPNAAARMLLAANGGGVVVTLNFELLSRAAASSAFAKLICDADHRICDGIGGQLLLRRGHRGKRIPRIPGIDLGYALLCLAAEQKLPVFFLGGKPGVAERAAGRLQGLLPALRIAGTAHGYFTENDLPALRGKIRASGAGLLIVCLGSPRQEEWIVQNRRYLPEVRLFLPLGGSLDVWAGDIRRAPTLWQKAGIEWLWRILHAPERILRLLRAGANLFLFFQKSEILFQIE